MQIIRKIIAKVISLLHFTSFMIAILHRVQVFTMYAMLGSSIGLNQTVEFETLCCSSNIELTIKDQITIETNFEIT